MTLPPLPGHPKKDGCFIRFVKLVFAAVAIFVILGLIRGGTQYQREKEAARTASSDSASDPLTPEERAAMLEKREQKLREIAAKPKPESVPEPEPDFVEWSQLEKLYALDSQATDLQKDAAWPEFRGRRIKATGEVVEVKKGMLGGLTLSVKMRPQTFTMDIIVRLRDDQLDAAAKLSKGQRVIFTAKLDRWGSLIPMSASEGEILGTP